MTQKEIAEILNVTQATVSMALRDSNRISPDLRESVQKLASDSGYRYNLAGQLLRKRKSNIIGVQFPRTTNLFFAELYQELHLLFEPKGYILHWISPHKQCTEALRQFCFSGVIRIGPSSDNCQSLTELVNDGVAVVLVNGEQHNQIGVCQVMTEKYKGVRELMNHLINTGRRKIVFMTSTKIDPFRHKAYMDSIKEADLEPRIVTVDNVEYMENGYNNTCRLLKSMPDTDAIFACNDELAIAAKRAILQSGLRIPEDIALAAMDNIAISAYLSPPLTTVEQPIKIIAKAIMDELFLLFENPKRNSVVHIPCRLIIRDST